MGTKNPQTPLQAPPSPQGDGFIQQGSYIPAGGISLQPFTADSSLYSPEIAAAMTNAYGLQKQAVDAYNQNLMMQNQNSMAQNSQNQTVIPTVLKSKYPQSLEEKPKTMYM